MTGQNQSDEKSAKSKMNNMNALGIKVPILIKEEDGKIKSTLIVEFATYSGDLELQKPTHMAFFRQLFGPDAEFVFKEYKENSENQSDQKNEG